MGLIRRRFLVLGLDGATFDLLDPLFRAGDLPFLSGLAARGIRAPLLSVYPAKTIPAWYSFATGLDPGELGIFGFTEPDGAPGQSRLVQSFRPAEAIWDRLSRLGRRVGVVNFPIQAPYPVHGFLLPGMFSATSATYPRSLRAEVEGELGSPYPPEPAVFHESERSEWIRAATESVERRGRAASILAERHRPEFLFALFRETDRLQHQLWDELSRPVDEIPDDLRSFWRATDRACASVDRAFRAAGGPAVTFVLSDHGHGRIESDFLTNRWLVEEGFLVFRDAPVGMARRLFGRFSLAAQRLPLARAVSSRIADFLREGPRAELAQLLLGDSSFEGATRQIDWERTTAYSYPVPEGIYLNPFRPELRGPAGRAVLDRLRARLSAYPDARIEVMEPSALYRGRRFQHAPALLIRVDGMRTEPRMDFAYTQTLIRDRPPYFCGSGTHRMDGVLLAAGDGIQPGADLGTLRLIDVAPTILDGMGEPTPAEWTGRSFGARLGLSAAPSTGT